MITRTAFLLVGIAFHVVYLRSIFDIYFISPVVHGMQQYISTQHPPAERLFLIVGDGLRADKLFENPQLAPFLTEKALKDGRWGISHTRVPTESRPGHVAIIAGLYEDVSAVTTGWKLNPVNFDSVFNQTSKTFAFGSPDILPMFKHGASDPSRVECTMYAEEAEDFTSDSTMLDTWVFDKVNALFSSTSSDVINSLRAPKSVFFLHLLGLDTAGHAHRPYSPEYLNNIKVVDEGVKATVELVEEFYHHDGKTSWVFTADHGMSDWGSHGDGNPDNTRTPLIAWGAGIKSPESADIFSSFQNSNEPVGWAVEARQRTDTEQADIAPLMSYLVGLNYPTNNVGKLPLAFLDAPTSQKVDAIYQNAKQIHAQLLQKSALKASQLRYGDFVPFTFSKNFHIEILKALEQEDYYNAEYLVQSWIAQSLMGLKYLQRYDWLFLRTLITLGYTGWMTFALLHVLSFYVFSTPSSPVSSTTFDIVSKSKNRSSGMTLVLSIYGLINLTFVAFLWSRSSPISYYAYYVFVGFFWFDNIRSLPAIIYSSFPPLPIPCKSALPQIDKQLVRQPISLELIGMVILIVCTLQAIVLGYADRRIFTIIFPVLGLLPLLYGPSFIMGNRLLAARWLVLCCVMASFTTLPTVQVENVLLITLGATSMIVIGLIYIFSGSDSRHGKEGLVTGAQIGLIVLALIITRSTSSSLAAKQGLPLGNQIVSWLILASSLLVPILYNLDLEITVDRRRDYLRRLVILFLTFGPTFVILTISYEGIFYTTFWVLLLTWVHLESKIISFKTHSPGSPATSIIKVGSDSNSTSSNPNSNTTKVFSASDLVRSDTDQTETQIVPNSSPDLERERTLTPSDARIALIFFFLLQAGFFGTGNIASVSSFSLDSVYRLLPIFNPFLMGLLLLYKLLVPFIILSAWLGALNRVLGVASGAIFMLVLTFCDILTLNFFWGVKDEGSWLEIGSSISAFVIGSLLILFVILLEKVSEVLVDGVDIRLDSAEGSGTLKEKDV